MKIIQLGLLFAFVSTILSPSVLSQPYCDCSGTYGFLYFIKLESPSTWDDVKNLPNINIKKVFFKDMGGTKSPEMTENGYDYWMITVCTDGPFKTDINGYDVLPIYKYAGDYFPRKFYIAQATLDKMQSYNNRCTSFSKGVFFECLKEAAKRWDGICNTLPEYVTLERGVAVGKGINVIYDDDPFSRWSWGNALAIYNIYTIYWTDGNGDVIAIEEAPNDQIGQDDSEIIFRLDPDDRFFFSTDCPCTATGSACEHQKVYNACKVFQHELGHALGVAHIYDNCPVGIEESATMNIKGTPCTEATSEGDHPCWEELRCSDLCMYCKRHCPNDCGTLTSIEIVDLYMPDSFEFDIYPNPSTMSITLNINDSSNATTVLIVDLQGKMIYNKHFDSVNELTLNLKLLGMKRGVYFIQIHNDKKMGVKKLILQ